MTQADFDAAIDTFVLPERVQRRAERVSKRTYYSEALRDYLLNRSNILGDTYEERYTRLYRGGLSIHTTLDPFVQARAEEARNQLPDNTLGIDAAITSLETKTGAIRAMVGGRGVHPRSARGQSGAGAEPDRIEHQAVRARRRRCRPAPRPRT